jgi:hypothetical protein
VAVALSLSSMAEYAIRVGSQGVFSFSNIWLRLRGDATLVLTL